MPGEAEGTKGFDQNWRIRREARNNYWTSGTPRNQIELAFRMHWRLFQELLDGTESGRCLEVGCGRGTASSYFASDGFDCVLLDYSKRVLDTAVDIFDTNSHRASFVCGDANALPFPDDTFDVVVSIGLLEHFKDVVSPVREQIRVLKNSGLFLGYVVPARPENVQKYFQWFNRILKLLATLGADQGAQPAKAELYRNDLGSAHYLPIFRELGVRKLSATGVYPLPMISHSPEFPFSLMKPWVERLVTGLFESVLVARAKLRPQNPWMCHERFGQAFLISCRKGDGK